MSDRLSWGVIGAGRIARVFASGVAGSKTGRLVACADIERARADKFADELGIANRYGAGEELLSDPAVQAVYVSTPHPFHAEWAIRAAEAGKHVLCEKPIALNHAEAMAVVEAARANDVFLMEAFMYRCHPQIARLVALIRAGEIGEVRLVEAAFSFAAGLDLDSRLFNQALGGGGILDVGCYCTSMARLVAGVAVGKDFDEPIQVKAVGRLGDQSRVDEWTIAALEFPSGIVAQLATGVRLDMDNAARIFGSKGWILMPEPWGMGQEGGVARLIVHRQGEPEPEEIAVRSDRSSYSLEADTVAAHLEQRQASPPAMTWEDTLGNMKTMDMWRASIGLVYDSERPEAQVHTVSKRPLAVAKGNRMKYGSVPGVGKRVSRLIMGADNQGSMPHTSVMFDDYFTRGGNCFDTAYIYAGGLCERLLGHWIKNRGVRDQVAIIGKGVHTPHNRPEYIAPQLEETLSRLQTDYVDIYFAHRDNPEVPIGEWVDAFNEQVEAGRMHAYGGSNWELARVQAANEYAAEKDLVGMAGVSNNFSLARMIHPVWGGCIASSDAESRAWLERTQLPLFAWSSQARGFFTERGDPSDRSDEELVHSWYSDDNFQRQARAKELAGKKGVLPIMIALAYVLCQAFPTFALIGPRSLAETRTSFEALDVELTPEELRWLNLED